MNIPACATPLVLALLALAASGSASTAKLGAGCVSLGPFGLALSLPLVLAVFFALGLWSIRFGLLMSLQVCSDDSPCA